jgi:hypothetical protein
MMAAFDKDLSSTPVKFSLSNCLSKTLPFCLQAGRRVSLAGKVPLLSRHDVHASVQLHTLEMMIPTNGFNLRHVNPST